MVDPQVIIKANYNRTLLTIRVTAINSPDWVDIVGTRIELFRDANFTNRFVNNSTTHYKVRAYLENETPDRTIYGKITLTKDDNTTHESTFSFVVPFPVLGTVKDENGMKYITSMRKMDKNGNLSPRNYANKAIDDTPPYIDIMADEPGEMVINNQWTTPILVQNITQGTAQVEIAGNNRSNSTTIAVNTGDIVRILEGEQNATFRAFTRNGTNGICQGVSAHISIMPSMEKFAPLNQITSNGYRFTENAFSYFNCNGTLTSLPEGSFDIHKLIGFYNPSHNNSYGTFIGFNRSGALTSLPEGSFDTSNITSSGTIGSHFRAFNAYGALTSLPEGSFDFDRFISPSSSGAGASFAEFNRNGALTTLPDGSFGFSSFEGVYKGSVPDFNDFNNNGRLVSLPAGSFHFKKGKIWKVGSFKQFNMQGSLVSLPEHSFNFLIGHMNASVNSPFASFNYNGALTSLPEGSFRFDPTTTQLYTSMFQYFNRNGALTSLPEGSFNTDNIVSTGASWQGFNQNGALTSLPEGSFNFDNVTALSQYEFAEFNYGGALKSLPKGSFSFNSLTSLSTRSLYDFNTAGALEYLPIDSFNLSNVTTYTAQAQDYPPLGVFNFDGGKLVKSDTDYNPNFILPTVQTRLTEVASYHNPETGTNYTETISVGNPFKYYQADYFTVTYTPSQAYTTDLANTYLSGQTITFTATAIDPEYMVTPTITTAGGVTVAVTNNGDDTYTFIMPQDDIDVNFAVSLRPAVIMLVAEEAGTMKITNKWTTPVIVKNVTQDTSPVTVASSATTSLPVDLDDEITVTESSASITFRNWVYYSAGFATGVLCRISEMPAMNRFTVSSEGTSAGQHFFDFFCAGSNNKGITSLPAGSFDTSSIQSVGSNFFRCFNQNGFLTSLPAGSFDISGITRVSYEKFFSCFNYNGKLTSLPVGSFDTSNITNIQGGYFFDYFNSKGELTSLPDGSFDISGLSSGGEYFFTGFNSQGKLTSLPVGSFDTSNISYAGGEFFAYFNSQGKLTSLPVGSFNTSNITRQWRRFFTSFNEKGELTSLPDGSFDISGLSDLSSDMFSGSGFFQNFNKNGKLTSLPAGSFDTSNITSMGESGFYGFNQGGKLTSLPVGSFDISNITLERGNFFGFFNSGGELTSLPDGSFRLNSNLGATSILSNSFFVCFNGGSSTARGKLTSLPDGSFDTSHITRAWIGFFAGFNKYGNLTSLPAGSFNTSNISGEIGGEFFYEFNANGRLTSLPAGSFDTSHITKSGSSFLASFNYYGALTSLPVGSFNTDNMVQARDTYCRYFNYHGELTALPTGSFGCSNITSTNPNSPPFYEFNNYGKLEKDTTDYNPGFFNPYTADITAHYWTGSYTTSSTITPGSPLYYKTT